MEPEEAPDGLTYNTFRTWYASSVGKTTGQTLSNAWKEYKDRGNKKTTKKKIVKKSSPKQKKSSPRRKGKEKISPKEKATNPKGNFYEIPKDVRNILYQYPGVAARLGESSKTLYEEAKRELLNKCNLPINYDEYETFVKDAITVTNKVGRYWSIKETRSYLSKNDFFMVLNEYQNRFRPAMMFSVGYHPLVNNTLIGRPDIDIFSLENRQDPSKHQKNGKSQKWTFVYKLNIELTPNTDRTLEEETDSNYRGEASDYSIGQTEEDEKQSLSAVLKTIKGYFESHVNLHGAVIRKDDGSDYILSQTKEIILPVAVMLRIYSKRLSCMKANPEYHILQTQKVIRDQLDRLLRLIGMDTEQFMGMKLIDGTLRRVLPNKNEKKQYIDVENPYPGLDLQKLTQDNNYLIKLIYKYMENKQQNEADKKKAINCLNSLPFKTKGEFYYFYGVLKAIRFYYIGICLDTELDEPDISNANHMLKYDLENALEDYEALTEVLREETSPTNENSVLEHIPT
jgi:hypothetical protein